MKSDGLATLELDRKSAETAEKRKRLELERQAIEKRLAESRAEFARLQAPAPKAKHGFMIYRSSRSTVNDGYLDGAARNVGNFLGSVGGWICAFLLFGCALAVIQAVVSIF
jgi:hypothetical protein